MSAPGKLALHRMGFYNDQSGIIRRYKREEPVWQPHIEACKRLIIRAVSEAEPHHIAVAGAGSLLDLPLADLIREKRTITLVDIVPPLPAVTEAANLEGVSFLEDDISGGLVERVYRLTSRTAIRRKTDIPALLDFGSWSPPAGTDMIISLNILTQLTALPVDYLRRKTRITPDEEKHIRRTVQQRHLEMLRRYNSVLITDFAEITAEYGTREPAAPLLEVVLPPGVVNEHWEWFFDSHGGYNEGKTTIFRVAGRVFRR
jgi:hypothetical protein